METKDTLSEELQQMVESVVLLLHQGTLWKRPEGVTIPAR